MIVARWIGGVLLALIVMLALAAPFVAPSDPQHQFRSLIHAPPMRIRLADEGGIWHRPFVHPWRLVSRLEQRYEPDRTRQLTLRWLSGGKLVQAASPEPEQNVLLLLGADGLGRDMFSRIVFGARTSLAVALLAALGALILGVFVGALAGYAGGRTDEALMRIGDLVLVLPAIYVVLALRAVMPLVLPPSTVFLSMTAILALVGWPFVARGVRATIQAERRREYASAAVSLGASHMRLLFRHLLPASTGFLAVQATLLVPAFVLAEATLSYVGLGFPEPVPSWGSMLQDAADVVSIAAFPWMLAPAAAIFLVVLAFNLLFQGAGAAGLALPLRRD
jgi:peptide/nickel transport system permease protein